MTAPSPIPAPADPVRALLHAGQWEAAARQLQQRLQQDAGSARDWGLLAVACRNAGRPEDARRAAERATQLAPGSVPAWLEAAEALLLCEQPDAASAALDAALALPDARAHSARLARLCMDYAFACFAADRFEAGHAALERVLRLDPGFLPARWAQFQLPRSPAPASAEAARDYLQRWDRGVAEFVALDWEQPALRQHVHGCLAQCTAFYRHYLDAAELDAAGLDAADRDAADPDASNPHAPEAHGGGPAVEAQRRYGALLARMAAALGPRARSARTQPRSGRRRIGVVVAWRDGHTVDRLFGPLVTGLDRERLEVHVLFLDATTSAQQQAAAAAGASVHAQPRALPDWAALLVELDLDVLLYPEIGMDPSVQLLATMRFAPVQAMLWGHPVTSGLDSIDYVLSPDLLEPADAQAHYHEQLVRLPQLGCALQPHAVDTVLPPGFARTSTAPAGAELLCAQTVYKLMPAQDVLFARILAALPGARLHLIVHQHAHVRDWLLQRMRPQLQAHGVDPGRIVVHPFLPLPQYLGLARACDLALDTLGWSGGMSALDLLGSGVPIVAVEGRLMRQRQTAALLRLLDAGELVAADADDYVRRTVALAGDAAARARLRHTLQAHAPRLYNGTLVTGFLEDFLASAQPRAAR